MSDILCRKCRGKVHCVEEQTDQGKILVIKCVICGERMKETPANLERFRVISDNVFARPPDHKHNLKYYAENTEPCKRIGCKGFYHAVPHNKSHLCTECRAIQQKWENRKRRCKAFGPSPFLRGDDGMWRDNPEYKKGVRNDKNNIHAEVVNEKAMRT